MLWCFVFQYAVYIWISIPDETTEILHLDKFGARILITPIHLNTIFWYTTHIS